MGTIYLVGALVTLPIAYAVIRKNLAFMVEDGDGADRFMRELPALAVTPAAAFAWPLVWMAYLVTRFTDKAKEEDKLPEGYTLKVTDKARSFEAVAVMSPDGAEVSSAFTSVYGIDGAAKKAVGRALKVMQIENRPQGEYDKVFRKFGTGGVKP